MQAQKQTQVEKCSSVVFYFLSDIFFKQCFNQCSISTLQFAVYGSVLA